MPNQRLRTTLYRILDRTYVNIEKPNYVTFFSLIPLSLHLPIFPQMEPTPAQSPRACPRALTVPGFPYIVVLK